MGLIRAPGGWGYWDVVRSQWNNDVRVAGTEPWREKWVAGGLRRGAKQAASPADWAAGPPGAG